MRTVLSSIRLRGRCGIALGARAHCNTMNSSDTSLIALRCEQCRGSFDFRALEAVAVCPYCQHVQELPPELLARSAAHAANVETEQDRTKLQALIAERYAALQPTAWLGLAVAGALCLISISAISVAFFGRLGGVTVAGTLTILGLFAVFATSAALTTVRIRTSTQGEARTSFETLCPSCGASNSLAIGQTLACCAYCGVALVPGERLAAIGLGLAEAQTRTAKLNAVAASRNFRITSARRNRLLGNSLALVTPVLPAIVAVYSFQQYQLGTGEWSQVMVAMVATGLVLTAPFAIAMFRQRSHRPIDRVIATMSERPGSARLAGIEGTMCWLGGLWPDEFGEYYDLQPGAGYRALTTTNRGFSVLVAIYPGHYLHIAIAASIGMPKLSHETLKHYGFQCNVCQSGAIASLRGKALAKFGDPNTDQRLERCVDALVDAVQRADGRPSARC